MAFAPAVGRLSGQLANTTISLSTQKQSLEGRGLARAVVAPTRNSTQLSAGRLNISAKQNSLRRQKVSERNRQYNKSRKSAIATRSKKVLKTLVSLKRAQKTEDVEVEIVREKMQQVEIWVGEAYSEIDRAVVKGVIDKNTANRRKSKLARAKKQALIDLGLYSPEAPVEPESGDAEEESGTVEEESDVAKESPNPN